MTEYFPFDNNDELKCIVGKSVSIGGIETVFEETSYYTVAATVTFTFPAVKYDVTVNNGTGSGRFEEDNTVTITADTPDSGKRFKAWTVVSDNVSLASPESSSTTFIMPKGNVEVTATYEIVPAPSQKEPTITTGASTSYQINSNKNMTFTCSGELEDLSGIYVDGKIVNSIHYILKSGSTILTLKSSYLDSLSAGEHTLKFQYKDNVSVETEFTIKAKADKVITDTSSPETSSPETSSPEISSPKTGDTDTGHSIFLLCFFPEVQPLYFLPEKNRVYANKSVIM